METKVIVADFSLNEDEYIRIFESLDDLDIGVLGNILNNTFSSLINTCSVNIYFSLLICGSEQCWHRRRTTK